MFDPGQQKVAQTVMQVLVGTRIPDQLGQSSQNLDPFRRLGKTQLLEFLAIKCHLFIRRFQARGAGLLAESDVEGRLPDHEELAGFQAAFGRRLTLDQDWIASPGEKCECE